MKFFKKADEMEIYIALKSTRLSFAFMSFALSLWILIEAIKTGELPFYPFMIVTIGGIIFWASNLYFRKKMTGHKDEE